MEGYVGSHSQCEEKGCLENDFVIDMAPAVQVLYSTPGQSKSGSACHMTRSANHRRLLVVI